MLGRPTQIPCPTQELGILLDLSLLPLTACMIQHTLLVHGKSKRGTFHPQIARYMFHTIIAMSVENYSMQGGTVLHSSQCATICGCTS